MAWFAQGWHCKKSIDGSSAKVVDAAAQGQSPEIDVPQRQGNTVYISVPQRAIRLLIGKAGATVQRLQEETKCRIKIHDASDSQGHMKQSQLVEIRYTASSPSECTSALELCLYTVRALCIEQDGQPQRRLEEVLTMGRKAGEEMKEESNAAQQREEAEMEKTRREDAVRQVKTSVGDLFSRIAILAALCKEHWDPNQAEERLFRERSAVPAADSSSGRDVAPGTRHNPHCELLASSAEENDLERAVKASLESFAGAHQMKEDSAVEVDGNMSNSVRMIRDVFHKARARNLELQQERSPSKQFPNSEDCLDLKARCARSSCTKTTRRVTIARRC